MSNLNQDGIETARLLNVAPEFADDPLIRRKLLQIRRREIELALRREAEQQAPLRRWEERPIHGPCTRCGHIWKGRSGSKHPPLHCSRCNSRYWMQEPTHKDRARTPTDPPHPNWKSRKGRSANQFTSETSHEIAAAVTAGIASTLPPPPRPAPRPLADMLRQFRSAAADPNAEPQPERFSNYEGATTHDDPALVPAAEPGGADPAGDPSLVEDAQPRQVHLVPDGEPGSQPDAPGTAEDAVRAAAASASTSAEPEPRA